MQFLQICQILLQLSFKNGFPNLAIPSKQCLQSEADGMEMMLLSHINNNKSTKQFVINQGVIPPPIVLLVLLHPHYNPINSNPRIQLTISILLSVFCLTLFRRFSTPFSMEDLLSTVRQGKSAGGRCGLLSYFE